MASALHGPVPASQESAGSNQEPTFTISYGPADPISYIKTGLERYLQEAKRILFAHQNLNGDVSDLRQFCDALQEWIKGNSQDYAEQALEHWRDAVDTLKRESRGPHIDQLSRIIIERR